jgi:DNA topoisomerase-1
VARDETKYERMPAFAAALPKIRARTLADLARPGLPREKVLAAVVQLLQRTLIRVGNDEYARDNNSFGLTTMRDRHVRVRGRVVRFDFRGKSGVRRSITVTDKRLARIVKNCRDLPGQELFQYVDDEGRCCDVGSADVNAYLKEVSGRDFTAKDFRTWAGTLQAVAALEELGPAATAREAKSAVLRAIDQVAERLNNTRAVCRKYYVHPAVLERYEAGTLHAALRNGKARGPATPGLEPDEQALVRLLRHAA